MPEEASSTLEVADLFTRVWVCQVRASGYHNGVNCGPLDPHHYGWRCGYRWWAAPLTDEEAAPYGLTTRA